ncbi:hypothetical protein NUU61_007623 [Penicillium alfredii]|uniref:Peptidase A1 domain-containing protein n=1 Tax=Penicillium alfredii TaxID=1506179 RepID=A0A9W9EQY2_9EURO|nr:uncharacterized protein NUU61_007623 [Penicillium alfredii]KAJ5086316.1 hypothetical protein NUU61_007623 [Penicillium alfredii]
MKPLRYCVLALWTLGLNYGLCSSPQAVTWSDKKFGPDGPWQAVIVDIGSNSSDFVIPSENNSRIALYPGGSWDSKILLTQICDNKTLSSVCYADKAGRFDGDASVSFDNKTVSMLPFPGNGPCGDLSWGAADAIPVRANAKRARDWITIGGTSIPDVDLVSISAGWRTYPGGQAYPLEVGTLSLGAPDINQTFGAQIKINMTFVTSYLYERQGSKGIPSYSYGMHIGSASLGIPGSLHLGGYDRNRIIGDISAQPFDGGNVPIQMNDIGIGVEEGGSPWSFASKTDLLAQGNSSLACKITEDNEPFHKIHEYFQFELSNMHSSSSGLRVGNESLKCPRESRRSALR